MTWDGVPEHRNLNGDGTPKTAEDYRREIEEGRARLPQPRPKTPGEFFREQAERMGWKVPAPEPEPDPMPADPFNGLTEAAVAQVAMIEEMREAGLSEPQALYYVACLVQVGRAMAEGGMLGEMPEPPEGL